MKQKGNILIIVVSVLAILVVVGFLSIQKPASKSQLTAKITPSPQETSNTVKATPAPSTDPSLIIGWKTYISPAFSFEIKYPREFSYLDNGPASSETPATTSAQLTSDQARIADKITFTDSNKKSFTLNVYPLSADPNSDTNLINFNSFAPICALPAGGLSSKVGDLAYNQVYRTGPKGESLVYFCLFSPKGNLIVLRNNSGSTEIAMRLMLSTLKFAN
jgi:hypothetical protein